MKFGVIGSISKTVQPQATGGIEVWTSLFLLESIKRGTTFDLYGLPGSLDVADNINLIPVAREGLDDVRRDGSFMATHPREYESMSLIDMYFSRVMVLLKEKQKEYDLVINSAGSVIIPLNWDLYQAPLLNIGHFPATEPYASFFEYFPIPPHVFYSFPTQLEFELAKWIPDNQKFLIPHGIDTEQILFEEKGGDKMVWVGRIDANTQKGAPQAIAISNKMKIPLNIYTYIEDKADFETAIKPLLSEYTNLQTGIPRTEFFKDAKLFLFPLQKAEAFGLTMVEAMASGTPVVAYNKGSVSEIVKDGETGFIVNSSDEEKPGNWIIKQSGEAGMMEAIERIYAMDPVEYQTMKKACRDHVQKNFSVGKMVDGYEAAYSKMLEQKR